MDHPPATTGEDEGEEGRARGREACPSQPARKDSSRGGGSRRRRRKDGITFCGVDCKYDVIRKAVKNKGWQIVGHNPEEGKVSGEDLPMCNVHWVDVALVNDRVRIMRPWQRVNHFPGMTNIARKARLAQNLEKMRKEFPRAYGFYPRTWVLPLEIADFRTMFDAKGQSKRTFIVKPDAGCQGKGIFLTQQFDKINPMESQVAQQYIKKPLLIDGFKFDLRLYVLVTGCKPLRMFMFHDGLVRLCTQEYIKPTATNLDDRCMHLTNYAVNKHNENFVANASAGATNVGSKRSLKWFMEYVADERGQQKATQLWQRMGSLCVKVILSILPTLQREYDELFNKDRSGRQTRQRAPHVPAPGDEGGEGTHSMDWQDVAEDGSHCFEILGVDVMIDDALKPWLIEINHLPSFATDSPMDLDIKSAVVEQTLRIIRAKRDDRRKYEEKTRKETSSRLYGPATQGTGAHARGGGVRPVVSPVETERVNVTSIRKRIEAVYQLHAPDRLANIDALLQKYKGREAKLADAVEAKYRDAKRTTAQELPQTTAAAAAASAEGHRREDGRSRVLETHAATEGSDENDAQAGTDPRVLVGEPRSNQPEDQDDSDEDDDGDRDEDEEGSEAESAPASRVSSADAHVARCSQAKQPPSRPHPNRRLSQHRKTVPMQADGDAGQADGLGSVHASDASLVPPEAAMPPQPPPWRGDIPDEVLDQILEEEDALLDDFDRIFPAPEGLPVKYMADYEKLMGFAFEHEEKRMKRMLCPLQQKRGSALEFMSDPILPPLSDDGAGDSPFDNPHGIAWRADDAGGRNIFDNNPFRRVKLDGPVEPKQLPMPGKKQVAAADRLMKGYSAQRNRTPPSLQLEGDDMPVPSRISESAAYAKEWRTKIEFAKSRRQESVALKPKTFCFIEEPLPYPAPEPQPKEGRKQLVPPNHRRPPRYRSFSLSLDQDLLF